MESDGDSLFNAGFCLHSGLGVPKDSVKAAQFFRIAVQKFGHFGSVHTLGGMYMLVRHLNSYGKTCLLKFCVHKG
jgi:TPR repeat protein